MRSDKSDSSEYLTAAQVMSRYGGVSHMWIERKLKDSSFPRPVRFGGRLRFWRAGDLLAWERATIAGGSPQRENPRPRAK